MIVARLLPVAILVCAFVSLTEARQWTDESGTFQVEAEFVKFADGNVLQQLRQAMPNCEIP